MMRSLFVWFYSIIIGFLILAFSVMEILNNRLYEKEFQEDYLYYAGRLVKPVYHDLLTNPQQHTETLSKWQEVVGSELHSLTLVENTAFEPSEPFYISESSIGIVEDSLIIIAQLPLPIGEFTALKFEFVDSYSDEVVTYYFLSEVAVYLFMALVIGLLTLLLYRYINRISDVSAAIAKGDYSKRLSSSKIKAFNQLAEDINKMAKTLQERSTESDIFIGAIQHELRIPVTRIRLALDMILDNQDPLLTKELAKDMDADLEELSKQMEELLALSRLRLQESKEPENEVKLAKMVNNCLSRFGSDKFSFNCDTPGVITGNEVLLERAISNVLRNADKYAKNEVQVRLKKQSEGILLVVSDDGPGIPEQEQELVFKPFYRVDQSRNRHTGGVGLGLAISSIIIKQAGGSLTLTNSSLGGAEFSFRFPTS